MSDQEDDYAKLVVSNAALSAAAAALKADIERLRAMLPSPDWKPLKAAAFDANVNYETARS